MIVSDHLGLRLPNSCICNPFLRPSHFSLEFLIRRSKANEPSKSDIRGYIHIVMQAYAPSAHHPHTQEPSSTTHSPFPLNHRKCTFTRSCKAVRHDPCRDNTIRGAHSGTDSAK